MGIGYKDSVVLYNRYVDGLMETEHYIGTRFDGVRVELTKGANQLASGMENADACLVKIPNGSNLPKPYVSPEIWILKSEGDKGKYFTASPGGCDFMIIVQKDELGINVDAPTGVVESDAYEGGLYQYLRNQYGYTYGINTVDVYQLIPRFEVRGK